MRCRFIHRNLRTMQVCLLGSVLSLSITLQSGCINSLVMASKVMLGDPTQPSGFEVATGTDLCEEEQPILLHVSAPAYVADEFDMLTIDIQQELTRSMRRREMDVISPDRVADILDDYGGQFDPKLIAVKLDGVKYIFHIKFDSFSYLENNSPNLYRGKASGHIVGYEVRGEGKLKHAVQVYDQAFRTTYPGTHPVQASQTPKTVFINRFIDRVSTELGHTFYSVSRSELYAN